MPMDKSRYPDHWEEIARGIKDAAGWKCEECGAEHNSLIIRSDIDPAYYITSDAQSDWFRYPSGELVGDLPGEYATGALVKVVLTVHHIGVDKPDGSPGDPEDKMDCREENLIALCQRDHLLADMPGNIPKRKYTLLAHKRESQLDAGQGELF